MKTTAIGLSVVLGALVAWVNTNLGELFWVVLALAGLDILIGVVQDTVLHEPKAFPTTTNKMLKSVGAIAIPVFIANFKTGVNLTDMHAALQMMFALVIIAQLSGIVPLFLKVLAQVATKLSGGSKNTAILIDKLGADEAARLIVTLQKKLATEPLTTQEKSVLQQAANEIQAAMTQKTAMVPTEPTSSGGSSSS